MEGLFGDNLFFIYLFFIIAILNYKIFSTKQKYILIYICSFGLTYNEKISKRLILAVMCMILFLCQEYFTKDEKRILFLRKFRYKLLDWLYMSFLQYRLAGVLLAVFLRTNWLRSRLYRLLPLVDGKWINGGLEVLAIGTLFWLCIHGMFKVKEKFHSFSHMYERIMRICPYARFTYSDALARRLELIVDMEDHSYFLRKHSYSFLSREYIHIWRQEHQTGGNAAAKRKRHRIRRMIHTFVRLVKKVLFRGHSTIGMQLIRILSYKEGLILGRPKNLREAYRTLKRKAFECFYAKMFFDGLECYLKEQLCNEVRHYRSYLVYLYAYIAQAKVDGRTYVPMAAYFAGQPMENWDISELFIACMGLNSLAVTEQRLECKSDVMDKFGVEV